MNGSTTIRRNANSELGGFRSFMWICMVMSLAVVFFGMQLMMVGPLQGRLDGIQARLEESDGSMKKLVAGRDAVWKTNNLLTSIEEQASHVRKVQASLSEMEKLRISIHREAEASAVAMAALDRMSAVQERIVAGRQQTLQATNQITKLDELLTAIIHGSENTEVAANSMDGIVALQNRVIAASNNYEKASEGITNLADLTQRMVAQSEELKIASAKFDEFVGLANSIRVASVDLDSAKATAAEMSILKEQLLASGEQMDVAQENVRVLVAMNDTLSGESLKLDVSRNNLDSLVAMGTTLSCQSQQVGEAIQNLEIMDDFRTELAGHVKSLEGVRRTMMDIAMMESTLGRVAQVIEPLTQIGNLRRLSNDEMREAARVILDRRVTRFSQSDSQPETGAADNSAAIVAPAAAEPATNVKEELVPLPPEAR
ncbi:MAG: hypothetical protein O2856_10940 [Planctomycetota bacterium]|nr:hypothetical protein [Planctomycetota bacterium]